MTMAWATDSRDRRHILMGWAAIVSAPLWDSHSSSFAGILTATDYINVIQYYCQFPDEMAKLDQFRLSSLRGALRQPFAM